VDFIIEDEDMEEVARWIISNLPFGILGSLIFLVALLYSSVGHGGASGYLAALSLCGYVPQEMRACALLLNLLVSGIAFLNYSTAGHFDRRLFWPFAVASIPLAFIGGQMNLGPRTWSLLLAAALALACLRLMLDDPEEPQKAPRPPKIPLALGLGGGIGFLSGLIGVGGGIFLSPLMILRSWAKVHTAAGVSAAFIWVNSAAGLYGNLKSQGAPPSGLWPLALAAFLGGTLGSHLGARKLDSPTLRRLLGLVLLIAAFKLLNNRLQS
jgi:uncharacterized membrane protein YfcA